MIRLDKLTSKFQKYLAKSNLSYYGKLYNSYDINEEASFAARIIEIAEEQCPVIIDVGANKGDYSSILAKTLRHKAVIHCFEPSSDHSRSLEYLEKAYPGIVYVHRQALSSETGIKKLYKDQVSSGLASLYQRDISSHGIIMRMTEDVEVTTLDKWAHDTNIEKISFLKLDIEGHELDALRGATSSLAQGRISAIQFEFGGCNIDSRTYIKDFHNLLVRDYGYRLYRLAAKKRLIDLNSYNESHECFTWQNIIALGKDIPIPSGYSVISDQN